MEIQLFKTYAKQICKKQLLLGSDCRKPSDGSVCNIAIKDVLSSVNYESSYLSQPSRTVTIGYADSVIDRLVDYCICTMLIKEQSEFSLKVDEVSLTFVVTLADCLFKPYVYLMCDEEKLCLAQIFKQQGTVLFTCNRFHEAFLKFHRALQYLLVMNMQYRKKDDTLFSDDQVKSTNDLLVNIFNNMALCHLKLNNFKHAINVCTKSLAIVPNAKAYYRRAVGYINCMDYEQAETDLLKALELENSNKAILDKLKLVREFDKPNKDSYRETVKKMFS